MATAEAFISLARLRDAVGLAGDESDVLITGYRTAAISWLEQEVSRSILDRDGVTSSEDAFAYSVVPDFLYFGLRDIKPTSSITLRYADFDESPRGGRAESMVFTHDDPMLSRSERGVTIYREEDAETTWWELMRFSHPIPTITADQGMAAEDIPPTWADACAFAVRAMYDGTAYDDLGRMTVLQMMLRGHRQVYTQESP